MGALATLVSTIQRHFGASAPSTNALWARPLASARSLYADGCRVDRPVGIPVPSGAVSLIAPTTSSTLARRAVFIDHSEGVGCPSDRRAPCALERSLMQRH